MPYLFKRFSGKRGQVTIPDLAAVIGVMDQWEVTLRRGGETGTNRYDLRAVFSYVNPLLMNDPDYAREIKLDMGKIKFRAQMADCEETVLTGRALLVKGIQLNEH